MVIVSVYNQNYVTADVTFSMIFFKFKSQLLGKVGYIFYLLVLSVLINNMELYLCIQPNSSLQSN